MLGKSYQRENEFNARSEQYADRLNQDTVNRGNMITNARRDKYILEIYTKLIRMT